MGTGSESMPVDHDDVQFSSSTVLCCTSSMITEKLTVAMWRQLRCRRRAVECAARSLPSLAHALMSGVHRHNVDGSSRLGREKTRDWGFHSSVFKAVLRPVLTFVLSPVLIFVLKPLQKPFGWQNTSEFEQSLTSRKSRGSGDSGKLPI
jgi:hypothetical protein